MVYGLNTQLSRSAFYVFILLFFYYTKDNITGIAVLFILALHPWGLFYYKPYDWIFSLTNTVGVSFKSMIGVVILLKFFIYKSWKKNFIRDAFLTYYKIFGFYVGFLILWGLIFGYSAASFFSLIHSLPALVLFLVISRVFDPKALYLFNRIIFIFTLIHTFISIVDIISAGKITELLFFNRLASTGAVWDEELIRLLGGITFALYSFITGLYYLASRKAQFSTWFLWLVVLTSWFYILNSATRGWMIASIIMTGFFILYYSRRLLFGKKNLIIAFIIIALGIYFTPGLIKKNVNVAFDRFETVEFILEGDMTAGETARRWDERGPRVLTRFMESPVFGFGYSKVSMEYYDGHVGNHLLLLMGGVVGLAIVWLIVLSLIIKIFLLEIKNKGYTGIFVFGMGLIAIMIIHSTSRVMISFIMPFDSAFLLALIFNQINAHIQEVNYNNFYEINNNLNEIKENPSLHTS